jgi:cysteinyl-tRNA synthetase
MTIRLYNTLTHQKEDFQPLDPARVRLYVCGPTVYDYAHIGNARPVIVFDLLFRLLRHVYGETCVTYVRNITDVDDKINARAADVAAAQGGSVEAARAALTTATAQQFVVDVRALGCLDPSYTPRATEHIGDMIELIQTLIAAGHAYAASGHVLYDVASKPDYGKLSRRSLDEMVAGARVDVAPYKKNPMDFVLWKPSDANQPGWDSPWGRGRPGWHIECSAMSGKLLGETFDIHGGGIDLAFPHHENEIAQSEGAHDGHPLAKVWMHNGFLQVEGEKMSKSLGNFLTINDLLADWPGEALRFNMLKTHYRQPLDWTVKDLRIARKTLNHWYDLIGNTEARPENAAIYFENYKLGDTLGDDLNVPAAMPRFHYMAAELAEKKKPSRDELAEFKTAANFLGLLTSNAGTWFAAAKNASPIDGAEIEQKIAERNAARQAKNFAEADRLRDELLAKGIVIKDSAAGTSWEVKR